MRYRAVLINTGNRGLGTYSGVNTAGQIVDQETIEEAQKAIEQTLKNYSSYLANAPLIVYILDLQEDKIVRIAKRPAQPVLDFYTPPSGKGK